MFNDRYILIYSRTVKRRVFPSCLAEMVPPWAYAVALAMERPMPVPLTALEWDSSAR